MTPKKDKGPVDILAVKEQASQANFPSVDAIAVNANWTKILQKLESIEQRIRKLEESNENNQRSCQPCEANGNEISFVVKTPSRKLNMSVNLGNDEAPTSLSSLPGIDKSDLATIDSTALHNLSDEWSDLIKTKPLLRTPTA